jgi:hypothetical protein
LGDASCLTPRPFFSTLRATPTAAASLEAEPRRLTPLGTKVVVFRRLLACVALALWQGGFAFYAAVVVPVGQEVLESHRTQGFITQRVTNYLNAAGAVALLLLAWDAAADGRRTPRIRRLLWLAWAGLALSLGVLIWLHTRLDAMLDPEAFRVLDPAAFYQPHRWYLIVSTVQLGCAVSYATLTMAEWRSEVRPP